MLFEIFSALFDAGGPAPIKTKKAKIAGRVRRQAIWVRLSSASSGSLRAEPGFFPAYHMSKEHWISVELAAVDDDKLRFLIDMSWELTS
ncbi:MAG: MmcQ/YjbR family DNA-binding protein [Oscillospiraceae bacterium]